MATTALKVIIKEVSSLKINCYLFSFIVVIIINAVVTIIFISSLVTQMDRLQRFLQHELSLKFISVLIYLNYSNQTSYFPYPIFMYLLDAIAAII